MCELLSVDSLLAIINELYSNCDTAAGSHEQPGSTQPTPEDLLLLRQQKKVTDVYNSDCIMIS